MKNSIKITLLAAIVMTLTSCVKDDDTALAPFTPLVYLEDFEEAQDGTQLDIPGFTNFSETGSLYWKEEVFDKNGYTEFVANAATTDAVTTWLITPAITLGNEKRTLSFQSAQHHLAQQGAKLEVFISTNYNSTDVATATWIPLKAITPTLYNDWYKFIYSGAIDLSGHSGTVHLALKATIENGSSGTGYFIDNIKVY
ncbi:choice-of-anchor J domain-containing protein [Flavobacterium cerinum]|uniref:DUF5017 domain-containing protein n=1 Tax=Flavobacterium cerinum TaxID=2502784 RepID=A0A444H935_9FLAO|nr:choice-of-anchor J domain-containing protein [Flavobacterium cerinum]RWW99760.1 hypothetical protein EPI11_12475 [Flavobacterium cerinum]